MKTIFIQLAIMFFLSTALQAQNAFGEEHTETLLFFPGLASSGEVWHDTVSELAKDYKCYVFTFAGFGGIPPIARSWLTTVKTELLHFIEKEGIRQPTIIGHSLGGTLGYWMTITHPELFKQVIAVDALPGTAALMFPDYNGEVLEYDNLIKR